MKYEIKVTDPKHEMFGKTLYGARIYFDIYHTGNGPDLFSAQETELGPKYRLLSNQIDEEYYEQQEQAEEIKRLGANVGDVVMILDGGGGGSGYRGFSFKQPHIITKVDPSGHVEFDNGFGTNFRPKVVKV